ncbi:family 43 glycosylhydrolase [Streptosporangium canum]
MPGYRTLEGPKLYKRDGWYWIFAPAGGVATGWQSAFRSRHIAGPYETPIPHGGRSKTGSSGWSAVPARRIHGCARTC